MFCECHDDYVAESGEEPARYEFYQVKTREQRRGPWPTVDFFGLYARGARDLSEGKPFEHLHAHVTKFGTACARLVFVSDNVPDDDIEQVRLAARTSDFSNELFQKLLAACQLTSWAPKDAVSLGKTLSMLEFARGVGVVTDGHQAIVLLAEKIDGVIDSQLKHAETQRIAKELVEKVRVKSTNRPSNWPAERGILIEQKGLTAEDVIETIGLSRAGFATLSAGPNDPTSLAAGKRLSRLTRMCRQRGMPGTLINDLCRIKAQSDAWLREQKHKVPTLDLAALNASCSREISRFGTSVSFDAVDAAAQTVTQTFATRIVTSPPLTADVVAGIMLSQMSEA